MDTVKNTNVFWRGFLEGSRRFGYIIASIINFILLFFVYFFGVGLASLFAKIFRKHFLKIKSSKEVDSYWEPLDLGKVPQEGYYRQF